MGLHLLLVLERLVADGALVALGAVVLDAMQFQHMIVAKVPEADVTVVGLLARVRSRVHLELLGAGETFAASRLRALVRLLAGVRAHMDHQLAGLDECLLAHGALVWPLAGVNAHVAVQLPGVFECPSTDVTLVRTLLRVDAPVHLEVLLHAEQLVAELALEWPFTSVGAVVADLKAKEIYYLLISLIWWSKYFKSLFS